LVAGGVALPAHAWLPAAERASSIRNGQERAPGNKDNDEDEAEAESAWEDEDDDEDEGTSAVVGPQAVGGSYVIVEQRGASSSAFVEPPFA